MITICLVYFRSLTLANLAAALHSLREQNLSDVESVLVVDNNTEDTLADIASVVDVSSWNVPVELQSFKHKDLTHTHAWSTNIAVRAARTPWVLFTRADYLLDYTLVEKFSQVLEKASAGWEGFVTSRGRHLQGNIGVCEQRGWRSNPSLMQQLPGADIDYTSIDSGVWMARRSAFESVGGLDEELSAWGHVQTHFQYKLFKNGVRFVCLPEVLFYHPQHSAPRDLGLAHEQLRNLGVDLKQMWARYEGPQPY